MLTRHDNVFPLNIKLLDQLVSSKPGVSSTGNPIMNETLDVFEQPLSQTQRQPTLVSDFCDAAI
jgi:hypothetical protein